MVLNPYSPSSSETSSEKKDSVDDVAESFSLTSIAKPIFLAWERLRIIYIIVLGLFTVLLVGPNIAKMNFIIVIAQGAIVANVCFFAGPVAETYLCWLGYERKWVRWCLFVGGTMLTMILALLSLASMLLPDQS